MTQSLKTEPRIEAENSKFTCRIGYIHAKMASLKEKHYIKQSQELAVHI